MKTEQEQDRIWQEAIDKHPRLKRLMFKDAGPKLETPKEITKSPEEQAQYDREEEKRAGHVCTDLLENYEQKKSTDMEIKQIVKGNKAVFTHYKLGHLYYDVVDKDGERICSVPVDVFNEEDIGQATYPAEVKAISLMRYIRKAQKEEKLAFYK